MTPDEIQRLMSGYATGSLTESERKLLFEAALEDQHLFDQLAQEQALKELIDQPGARDRLIAALAPAETSRAIGAWKKPLAWGLAAMFVVSMSVAAMLLTRSGIRTEVAQKQIAQIQTARTQTAQTQNAQTPIAQTRPAPSSQPSAPPEVTAPGSGAPYVSGSPSPAPARQMRDRRSTSDGGRGDLDAAVRARPNAPAARKAGAADEKKATADKLERVLPEDSRRANSGVSSGSGIGSVDALRPATASPTPAPSPRAPPPPLQTTPQSQVVGQLSQPPAPQPQAFVAGQAQVPERQAQAITGQVSSPQTQGRQDSTGSVQNARNQAQTERNQVQSAAGGGGGGRGGAGVGGAAIAGRAARLAAAPPRFAFDYSIDGEDLVFKFSADGYFSLHIAPGGLTIVDSRVTAGSTRREHITANGTEAVIVFSASPQSDAQGVSIETRARSLTVEDPARKRIDVLLKFY